jgi:hypothetical protein
VGSAHKYILSYGVVTWLRELAVIPQPAAGAVHAYHALHVPA